VKGLLGAEVTVVGQEKEPDPVITVPADDLQSLRVYVTLDKTANAALPAADAAFSFVVTSADGSAKAEHESTFQGPGR
jgi:hypothetical protein